MTKAGLSTWKYADIWPLLALAINLNLKCKNPDFACDRASICYSYEASSRAEFVFTLQSRLLAIEEDDSHTLSDFSTISRCYGISLNKVQP
jgi:hypothetical protein